MFSCLEDGFSYHTHLPQTFNFVYSVLDRVKFSFDRDFRCYCRMHNLLTKSLKLLRTFSLLLCSIVSCIVIFLSMSFVCQMQA